MNDADTTMQPLATSDAASIVYAPFDDEYLLDLSEVGVSIWLDREDLRDLLAVLLEVRESGHLDGERDGPNTLDAFRDIVGP